MMMSMCWSLLRGLHEWANCVIHQRCLKWVLLTSPLEWGTQMWLAQGHIAKSQQRQGGGGVSIIWTVFWRYIRIHKKWITCSSIPVVQEIFNKEGNICCIWSLGHKGNAVVKLDGGQCKSQVWVVQGLGTILAHRVEGLSWQRSMGMCF